MRPSELERGREELIAARKESRALYWFVGVFSFFTNLLMLTGPIYMLQVYDRVLGSRSEATLLALTILVAFLYGTMGVLDFVRGRIMGRVFKIGWIAAFLKRHLRCRRLSRRKT